MSEVSSVQARDCFLIKYMAAHAISGYLDENT